MTAVGTTEAAILMRITPDTSAERPGMTLRVYRTTREGVVTEIRRTVNVVPDEKADPYAPSMWPPCECPRHRA
jgi:hypothetical protein